MIKANFSQKEPEVYFYLLPLYSSLSKNAAWDFSVSYFEDWLPSPSIYPLFACFMQCPGGYSSISSAASATLDCLYYPNTVHSSFWYFSKSLTRMGSASWYFFFMKFLSARLSSELAIDGYGSTYQWDCWFGSRLPMATDRWSVLSHLKGFLRE